MIKFVKPQRHVDIVSDLEEYYALKKEYELMVIWWWEHPKHIIEEFNLRRLDTQDRLIELAVKLGVNDYYL